MFNIFSSEQNSSSIEYFEGDAFYSHDPDADSTIPTTNQFFISPETSLASFDSTEEFIDIVNTAVQAIPVVIIDGTDSTVQLPEPEETIATFNSTEEFMNIVPDQIFISIEEPVNPTDIVTSQPPQEILTLPPTPKRKNKRSVKRTHPFAEGNVEEMKRLKLNKEQKLTAAANRKAERIEKQNKKKAEKLEAAKKQFEKIQARLELLNQRI
jgi:hypothetical protein